MTKRVGSLDSHGAPVLRKQVVANTVTITELDSVKLSSGFVALGTAGALVFGHVIDIIVNRGTGVLSTGVAGAEVGSFVGTFATASDNQTVAMVGVKVDVSKDSLYTMTPDAAIGGTTGSNLAGYKIDIADEDNTSETSTTTTTCQYNLWGVDPELTSNHIVNIYESQVFGV